MVEPIRGMKAPVSDCIVDDTSWGHQPQFMTMTCPTCDQIFVHVDKPYMIDGEDAYKAWEGRGDAVVVPFWGECGSKWEMWFGFHKGETTVYLRILERCDESHVPDPSKTVPTLTPYVPPISPSLRFEILKRDNYRCRLCGVAAHDWEHVRLEVDHITPRSKGGNNDPINLWTLCQACNRGKGVQEL